MVHNESIIISCRRLQHTPSMEFLSVTIKTKQNANDSDFRWSTSSYYTLYWLNEFHECSCTYINVQGLNTITTMYHHRGAQEIHDCQFWLLLLLLLSAVVYYYFFLFFASLSSDCDNIHDQVEPFSGLPIIIMGFTFFSFYNVCSKHTTAVAIRSIPIYWKIIIESTRFRLMKQKISFCYRRHMQTKNKK